MPTIQQSIFDIQFAPPIVFFPTLPLCDACPAIFLPPFQQHVFLKAHTQPLLSLHALKKQQIVLTYPHNPTLPEEDAVLAGASTNLRTM